MRAVMLGITGVILSEENMKEDVVESEDPAG